MNFCRLNLVTAGSQVEIVLHTDNTVRAAGFELLWRTEFVSPCEAVEEVEAEEGEISLPHMETGYHLPYNCTILLKAPGRTRGSGRRNDDVIFIFPFQSTSR